MPMTSIDRLPHCACHSRRWFLRAGLAGAIALPIFGKSQAAQAEPHHAKALVLSCIDFRVMEAEHDFLAQHQLAHQYDWTALAGASLALAGFPHAAEAEAFWDQLDLSKQLHQIERVIFLTTKTVVPTPVGWTQTSASTPCENSRYMPTI